MAEWGDITDDDVEAWDEMLPTVIVLDAAAFDEMVRNLMNPSGPTESIKRAAELLRQLYDRPKRVN